MCTVIVNRYYVGVQMYSIFVDNHKNLSDDEIIKCIQQGKNDFLESLFSRYVFLVQNKVNSLGIAETELDDFVQEGLIALYHAAKTFDFSSATFLTYAKTCVLNSVSSLLKHKNRKRRIPENLVSSIEDNDVAFETTPEALMIERENFYGMCNRIRGLLSDFEYKVFIASLNGYSAAALSKKLNVSEKSVSNALCRLRNKIRTQLTENR